MGDPLDKKILYGPLHNQLAVDNYKSAIEEALKAGGKIEFGGKVSQRSPRVRANPLTFTQKRIHCLGSAKTRIFR